MKYGNYNTTVLFVGVLLLGFFFTPVVAQEDVQGPDSTLQDSSTLRILVDYNRFRYADSLTYLEYNLSLFQNMLHYVQKDDGRYAAQFMVTAELIKQGSDSVLSRNRWINENHVDSLSQISTDQRLFTLNNFAVTPGQYSLHLTVQDPNHEPSIAKVKVPVAIDGFESGILQISDVQLSSQLSRATQENLFVKNGYQVLPNPSALYGLGLPIMYTYLELYNLTPATTDSGNYYSIDYIITNRDGQEQKRYTVKHEKPGASAVEVYRMNVATLYSGPYTLTVQVTDHETADVDNVRKRFYVYRDGDYGENGELLAQDPGTTRQGSAGIDTERFSVMTEEQLDDEFAYCKYIAKKEEKETYDNLTLEGKRSFLKGFWSARDYNPATPINEFRQEYMQRIAAANNTFDETYLDGWKTDRGRVLMVYGNPDQIDRHTFESERQPYEIWHYLAIQGGVYFVFLDRKGTDDYSLVHSTARGELYDSGWKRWLEVDSDSDAMDFGSY